MLNRYPLVNPVFSNDPARSANAKVQEIQTENHVYAKLHVNDDESITVTSPSSLTIKVGIVERIA